MKSSDDAFGLLSTDWGGEVVDLRGQGGSRDLHPVVPSQDALYGGGLLRLRSQRLYGRVTGVAGADSRHPATPRTLLA